MSDKKKLLFLGATGATYDAVLKAKEMGIYTIVLDYYPNSPAKLVADKSYLVSTMDIDKVLEIARENEIDGVFTGYSDVNLTPARAVADALGLPFYASKEQIEVTTSKLLFKETCRKYGIPVVPEYNLTVETMEEDLKKIEYPVIIKPTDAYSSKGISVCRNEQELRDAVPAALAFSRCKKVIVERYLADYPDVCMYFNIQNGVLSLSAMCERDMNQVVKGKAMQPNVLFYPCRFIPLYYEQLETKFSNMVSGLKMQYGTMFVQCFVVDGVLMPFEMGYRLCGAQEYILCSAENGIDSLEMLIEYALTGKYDKWDAAKCNDPMFKHTDAILLMLLKPGKIGRIEGIDEVKSMPEILKVIQFYYEGDEIAESFMGTLNQTFSRIFIQCSDPEHMLKTIEKIQNTLKVYDTEGNEMIFPGYDCKKANVLFEK